MNTRELISLVLIIVSCSFLSCTSSRPLGGGNIIRLAASDKHIQYEGRISQQNGLARLYWPGTSATVRFNGTTLKAVMQDYNGQNYFNVVIDQHQIKRIRIDSLKKEYVLAEGLHAGAHTVSLIKITQIHQEYKRGYTDLYGFTIEGESKVLHPPSLPSRKIEFYGNSITCGHAILDSTGADRGASVFENNYLAYPALTARHYNARYRCIAKSGIGVMVSFGDLVMSEMFDRTNPFDSLSKWNFKEYQPGIIVVNLFQNDKGILGRPEYVQYQRRFGSKPPGRDFIVQSYQTLISKLRDVYPSANIICVLGSMDASADDSPFRDYVKEAVSNLHDSRIFYHFFAYKGSPKHPLIKDHEEIAKSLINFIDRNIKW